MYPRPTVYDQYKATPNSQTAVAAFVTVRHNPHMGVSIEAAEQQLREALKREGHTSEYIDSAVKYAYGV